VESKKKEEFLNDRRTGKTAGWRRSSFLPFVKTAGIASIVFRLNHLRL
jgi:hypothetical protein